MTSRNVGYVIFFKTLPLQTNYCSESLLYRIERSAWKCSQPLAGSRSIFEVFVPQRMENLSKRRKSSLRIVKWDSPGCGKVDGSASHRWRTSWDNRALFSRGDNQRGCGKDFFQVLSFTLKTTDPGSWTRSHWMVRHLQANNLPSRGISHHLTTNKNMQKRKRLGLRTIDKNILTICKNKWIICNKWLFSARK